MSRVAAKLAVRPSSRPKTSSTILRATWVETKRSVVEWNVPTFSAREWRSAADEADGANGSCTWTKSSSVRPSRSSRVRDTSSGSETEPPRRNGRLCPTAISETQPGSANMASGSERSALILARPSRTSSRDPDGVTTRTLCPRRHSSSERRSTKRLTSWCCSQGQGVTCAIEKDTCAEYDRTTGGEERIVFHAEVIGSMLRPSYLKDARASFEQGDLSPHDFKRVEDRAVDQVIAMQEATGVEVVTDGEMRRFLFMGPLTETVDGIEPVADHTPMPWNTPEGDIEWVSPMAVTSKLRKHRSLVTEEYSY